MAKNIKKQGNMKVTENIKKQQKQEVEKKPSPLAELALEVKIGIFAIFYFCFAIILTLGMFNQAGPVGQ